MIRPRTLDDLGEAAILGELLPVLPRGEGTLLGPGDDAAVVAAPDGRVVVTTDVLVEGKDFRRDLSSAQDVGWKAGAQNLADLAAMGAAPTGLLLALVAPGSTEVSWVRDLGRGLAGACAGTGAGVVGGDLSSGPCLVVAVTALGTLAGRDPVRRDGARPGDVVAVAGTLGRSAAGLHLLLAGRGGLAPDLVAVHRRPRPEYAAGLAAADAGASAMLDVSDGLLRDLSRVCEASGVQADLESARLQVDVDHLAAPARESGGNAWDWVLGGGEDHALLACFPPGTAVPRLFRRIGTVRAGRPVVLVDGALPRSPPGWDHFRT